MTDSGVTVVAIWLTFGLFWIASAFEAKRTADKAAWWREVALRLGVFAAVLLVLRIPGIMHLFRHLQADETDNGTLNRIGVFLCAFGVALALYARAHLGRNWGSPVSRKEDPELVTSGPYAVLRHPIYTGFWVAMFGSVLADNIAWIVPLVLFGAYFVYSALREEKLMLVLFPEKYPAYRKRTKMLVPYVL